MAGKPRKIPSYCHHKESGQAVVRMSGRDHYLGVYGTPESHKMYQSVLVEHFHNSQAGTITRLAR